jgi:tetratricopeptide (TPR) repeat protein
MVQAHGFSSAHDKTAATNPGKVMLPELKRLHATHKNNPENIGIVDELVSAYIKQGRSEGYAHYFISAEKILKPYIRKNDVDERLLLHWADLLQHRHDFDQANMILAKLLKINPGNVRARLMRAVILESSGQYGEAIKDCHAIIGRTGLLIVTTCIARIKSLNGELESSHELLQNTLSQYVANSHQNEDDDIVWAKTSLAEMMLRSGKWVEAKKYFDEVLQSHPRDYYLLSVYADALIDRGHHHEVVHLLQRYKHLDKLLLRQVIAEKQINRVNADNSHSLNVQIKQALHMKTRGSTRMLARYYLDISNEPERALEWAKKNWKIQREPDDALLLARSLQLKPEQKTFMELQEWLSTTGLQDIRVQYVLNSMNVRTALITGMEIQVK